jgi:SAM-dependent methyltransferase
MGIRRDPAPTSRTDIPHRHPAPTSRTDMRRKISAACRAGEVFPTEDATLLDLFEGSIDRFTEIAWRLRGHHRVLDCGAGRGMLAAILLPLGHEVYAVDLPYQNDLIVRHRIPFEHVNLENDSLLFSDGTFDAVTCCQVLEHFVHSHLPATKEFFRVLRPGGICEIDVPNVASFRNRSRLLRGKNITWDYEKHYLLAQPVVYLGREFYPDRHNREFTADELGLLLRNAGFTKIEVTPIRSLRQRQGIARLKNLGTWLRDLVPGFRKTLLAVAVR